MSFNLRPCLSSILLLIGLSSQSLAAPKVVTSIKPVHGIVSAIMKGVGEPSLIVDGAASPHHFTLKPSQALELQEADVIFWIGPVMESFLAKPLSSLSQKAKIIELDKVPNLKLMEASAHDHEHEGEKEEEHAEEHKHEDQHEEGHEKHEEEHADEHKHEDEHEEGHEKHVDKHEEGHEKHVDKHEEEHEEDHAFDPHLWLSPLNANLMSETIANALVQHDPKNADIYIKNASQFMKKLRVSTSEIEAKLTPLKDKNYLVMHNAYSYFTAHFGLKKLDVIQLNENVPSGLAHIHELQEIIKTQNVVCIFSEPQLSQKLPKLLASDSRVKLGLLDPLGSTIESGPDYYTQLLQSLAKEFVECFDE